MGSSFDVAYNNQCGFSWARLALNKKKACLILPNFIPRNVWLNTRILQYNPVAITLSSTANLMLICRQTTELLVGISSKQVDEKSVGIFNEKIHRFRQVSLNYLC